MAKNLKIGMIVCASLLTANATYAGNSATQESLQLVQQTQKIKGTIVDSKTGEPIIGASVKVKGHQRPQEGRTIDEQEPQPGLRIE